MHHEPIEIRPFNESDSLTDLTAMLHRAYQPLARKGMRYLASHQDEAMTHRRLTEHAAEGFIATLDNRIVGTITLCQPRPDAEIPWYTRSEVRTFEQFAVDPGHQGLGIGARLMDTAEARARAQGATEIACDTSEHAADLIAMYQRRGYRQVATANWDVTNYNSVVLSRTLRT